MSGPGCTQTVSDRTKLIVEQAHLPGSESNSRHLDSSDVGEVPQTPLAAAPGSYDSAPHTVSTYTIDHLITLTLAYLLPSSHQLAFPPGTKTNSHLQVLYARHERSEVNTTIRVRYAQRHVRERNQDFSPGIGDETREEGEEV